MRKTFKYRLYANKEAIAKAEYWLELCHNLYNAGLAERIYAYHGRRKSLTAIHQMNELPELKMIFPEFSQVGSHVLQNVLRRLDLAFKGFFRRTRGSRGRAGFPRFKGRNRYNSFTFPDKAGWKLEDRYLSIRNIGRFKLKLSRPIAGNVKTITIHRTPTNKWYACFSCDYVPEKQLPQSDNTIGIDVGIKSFLTDSEGNKVENPKLLKHSLRELRVKQRKLARAKRGSNRRRKTKLQLSKFYEKVSNQRSDFHHKLANHYVQNYGVITIENLRINNLVKNHRLARDINDCAWGQFFGFLSYKAEEAGRELIKVNPRNTSKICSDCGEVNTALKLSDRTWTCLKCGTIHDRDTNAAINLERLGQSHQELTYAITQSVS